MAIIYLTQPLRHAIQGLAAPRPDCPVDSSHRLVRNGTFTRHALTAQGLVPIRVQRFLCRACHCTYSALPYDCQPYTAWTWPILVAVLVWRDRGRSLAQCLAWLRSRQIDPHPRTLTRWMARWRADIPGVIHRVLQWIAERLGTRRIPVWPEPEWSRVQHWHQLWRAVVLVLPAASRRGGWVAGSVLWGWLMHHNQCRDGTADGDRYREIGGEIG
ncbi:hypothetical protein [Sulfobacillus harzensis]|uniref:Uncharacterized protein n=1 Tax=Sulfobacillus harzensis TaxID=2729629 RepID=A0A7Y0Q542_9FIRM|nr:hypothetical protein [Sulfobacillus harzensis]NMP24691.1 hypothetical protein [Sulfobacillus harzensis]